MEERLACIFIFAAMGRINSDVRPVEVILLDGIIEILSAFTDNTLIRYTF
jgi:purine nucleoside phosphorylase